MPDKNKAADVTRGLTTVAAKIRALDAAGFSRSEIAKFLGKRYQHVRNVLVSQPPRFEGGLAERGAEWKPEIPDRLDLQLGPGGRIVIPSVYRSAMEVEEGDRLMARVVDGELRIVTPRMAIKLAQKMVRETIPGNDSLAASLIEDRRREFEREMNDG